MSRAPSFVYFDLDDTLLDHTEAERLALRDLRAAHPAHLGHIADEDLHTTYRQHNGPLWHDYGRGRITKAQLKRLRFAHTFGAIGVGSLDPDAASDTYLDRYGHHWRWADGARTAFRAIAEAVPVGLLTNGFREQQRAKLARLPEIEAACAPGTVLIAEEIGTWKPHAPTFALAAERAGAPPEDILYIGDSLRSDVEGATSAGWAVCWWNGDPTHDEHGALAVSDWNEIVRRALG
ncbi:MAG: HAD-IA family hydrolase [Bacteroidota bacterium]